MRVMARISMPAEAASQAIQDGTMGATMERTAERWQPEAMYFTTFDGRRTAFIVFNRAESSDMPPFAEPFFRDLNAEVQMAPVMDGNDLRQGLSQLG